MSDFIFSTKNIEINCITKTIQSIYSKDKPAVKEFHGKWGSLGVSRNLYNGFEPHETEEYISIVIGGPILEFQDNSFLNDPDSSDGTKAIYDRWIEGVLIYDVDLNGPFVILFINKITGEITCITDLMSFIPVYKFQDEESFVLSTHVDQLAKITNQQAEIDKVSIADFILHGVVTFPYTIYTNLFQIDPATEHTIHESQIKSHSYWIPKELELYKDIHVAAKDTREGIEHFINKITKESPNIAQFISGGEDSRTLSGVLQEYPRNAYIFLDQMNREGKIAEKVAKTYKAKLKVHTRDKLHYLNILPSCSDLVGSGSQYHHAHTFGFHKECDLNSNVAVYGGLLSDALLKGSHIKKIRGTGKLPFIPIIKNTNTSVESLIDNNLFTENTMLKLNERRRSHLMYVKEFRNESAEEWFELWPSSMNSNIPNIHANRRLFRSYEPFTSNEIVKISALVPQKWKLNRKLFHKAAKPLLKPTKWLFHGDGWLPYFPWYTNSYIRFTVSLYRKIGIKIGLIKGNQGPWGEWSTVVNSMEWKQTYQEHAEGFNKISDSFKEKELEGIFRNNKLNRNQKVNLMQVLYQLNK